MEQVELTPVMEEELSNGRGDSHDAEQPCDEAHDKPEH